MEEIHLTSQTLSELDWFAISNTMVATWLTMFVIIVISWLATRKMRLVPRGIQNFMEWVIESLLNLVQTVTQERKKAEKFLPLLATFFIFILVGNWMELVPGFGTIGIDTYVNGEHVFVPFLKSINTDLNTTLALAIISVFAIQIVGIAAIGFFKYAGKYINFHSPIDFFMGILEIISEIAKIVSFAFRLFGNIFAGEVLLVIIAYLLPYLAPLPFYALEIFVGFIQALVFTMLTAVFMTMATISHEEHENTRTPEQKNIETIKQNT